MNEEQVIQNGVIEQFRFVQLYDLTTAEMIVRLTSQEDAQLECTTESDEVVDATGAPITTIYKAKKANYTGNESTFDFNLAAAQFGTKLEKATADNKILVPASESLEAKDGKLTLKHKPAKPIKYIYKLVKNKLASKLELSGAIEAAPTEGTFKINETEIVLPENTTGTFLVDYEYESEKAVQVVNNSAKFPTAAMFKASVYMRDACTDERFLAWIVADKAKIDPAQLTLAFNSQGKHPVTINFLKDYCANDADLFKIIAVND